MSALIKFQRLLPRNNVRATVRCFCTTGDGPGDDARNGLTGEKCVNSVQLLGRLGNHPESRGTDQRPVTVFSMATSVSYRDVNSDFQQKTEWHRIAVFRKGLREWSFNSLKMGDRIYLSGSIRYSMYEDPETKKNMKSCSIIAEDIIRVAQGRSAERYDEMDPVPYN